MKAWVNLLFCILILFEKEYVFSQQKDSLIFNNMEIMYDWSSPLIEEDSLKLLYPQFNKLPPIPLVNIVDSSLLSILDTILAMETKCDYFSPDISVCFWFARYLDSANNISETELYVHIELGRKNANLEGKPIAFFYYRNHCIFIDDIFGLPQCLFSYTNIEKDFHYSLSSEEAIDDDRYSMYFYWYLKGDFYFHKKIDQCN